MALSFSAAALLTLAACGGSGSTAASSSTSAPSSSSSPAAELSVGSSSLGRIVVDGKGMTTYVFTKDTKGSGKSACAGACASNWPAVTTTSDKPSVNGVTGAVGTITLADGTKQVTVDGMPLYVFAKDTKAGDVNGQGVNKVWYVVGPDGAMVTKAAGTGSSGYGY